MNESLRVRFQLLLILFITKLLVLMSRHVKDLLIIVDLEI